MPDFEKSGREDLIAQLKQEIEVLLGYLPKQLTEDEVKAIVDRVVDELQASSMKDMGRVMAALAAETKGRADNKVISQYVKEKLK